MDHRIQNFEALAITELRLDALSIAEAGYAGLFAGRRDWRVRGLVIGVANVGL